MSSRVWSGLTVAGAVAALTLTPVSAFAAMPVNGVSASADDGMIVQVAQKKKRMTRQQEIDKSVDSGTVPARYRSSVPKQYQQYIPFAKQ